MTMTRQTWACCGCVTETTAAPFRACPICAADDARDAEREAENWSMQSQNELLRANMALATERTFRQNAAPALSACAEAAAVMLSGACDQQIGAAFRAAVESLGMDAQRVRPWGLSTPLPTWPATDHARADGLLLWDAVALEQFARTHADAVAAPLLTLILRLQCAANTSPPAA